MMICSVYQARNMALGAKRNIIFSIFRYQLNKMRSFATLTITLLSLYHHCNGFYSHITNLPRHHGVPAEVTVKIARVDITLITLGAMNKDDTAEEETKTVNYHPLRLANVAIALALASTIGASSGIAYEYSQPSTTASSSMTSSSTQLGASYSDSDFADFSLPSYQDVASAEINTNLKGGKELMGDQYKYKATTR